MMDDRPLRWLLEPIAEHLAHPATTEVTVSAPYEIGVEQDGRWGFHAVPEFNAARLEAIAILAARLSAKVISARQSSCTSRLPDGQRIKIMLPPAVPDGTVSLCIRRRALSFTPTLDWLAGTGYFDMLDPATDWPAYFRDAVIGRRKSVILSGGIGESKTTAGEALLRAIPLSQRIVTVEGSEEWLNLPHRNWQPLYFDEADPDSAIRRVQDAMQSRPDWLPFQEVRGDEAWALLRALKIGCPTITTVHAPSALRALDSLESMIRQSAAGHGLAPEEIHKQLRQYIGVICHCTRFLPTTPDERTRYRMTEVVEIGQTPADDRIVSCPR